MKFKPVNLVGFGLGVLVGMIVMAMVTWTSQTFTPTSSPSTPRINESITVPWLTRDIVDGTLIHPMIGEKLEDVQTRLLAAHVPASADDRISVDSGVLGDGKMCVPVEKFLAVKASVAANSQSSGSDNLIVFAFDHSDRCLGYWELPAFVN